MKIELIDSEAAFFALKPDWDRIVEAARPQHVCLTFDWFWSWWAAFSEGRSLHILVAYEHDELIGIAPLVSVTGRVAGLPARKIQFMYNENAPCCDFLISREPRGVLDAFLGHLLRRADLWDAIELKNIPDDSPHGSLLADLCRARELPFFRKAGFRSPYLRIDSDWQTYSVSKGKKFLKTQRNIRNRLKKTGLCRIDCVSGRDQALAVFGEIVAVSARSWKRRCGGDLSSQRQDRLFFEQLCRTFGQTESLRIWLLRVNGNPVAYEFHLARNEEIYALRSDFDLRFKKLSPGTYLDAQITRRYFDERKKNYDLCGHDEEAYKKRWTQLTRDRRHFLIYKPSLFGRFLRLIDTGMCYPLKEMIKRNPYFFRARRFLKGRR